MFVFAHLLPTLLATGLSEAVNCAATIKGYCLLLDCDWDFHDINKRYLSSEMLSVSAVTLCPRQMPASLPHVVKNSFKRRALKCP